MSADRECSTCQFFSQSMPGVLGRCTFRFPPGMESPKQPVYKTDVCDLWEEDPDE